MIELFAANTPNGWKISIMLEEIGYQYKTTPVDIKNDEQFMVNFSSTHTLFAIIVFNENAPEFYAIIRKLRSREKIKELVETCGNLFSKNTQKIP